MYSVHATLNNVSRASFIEVWSGVYHVISSGVYLSVISSGIFIATNKVATLAWPLGHGQCGEVYCIRISKRRGIYGQI